MESKRSIMLVDCQSFYASVEKAAHPELYNKPVAVGDPARKSGIVLAACPIAKSYGVSTAMRNFEALAVCPDLTIVRPRMKTYIDVSTLITEIYESFTDLVEPWSIDEQFIDVTGSTVAFWISRKNCTPDANKSYAFHWCLDSCWDLFNQNTCQNGDRQFREKE